MHRGDYVQSVLEPFKWLKPKKSQYMERNLSEHHFPGCGISCQIILNLQQLKKYLQGS